MVDYMAAIKCRRENASARDRRFGGSGHDLGGRTGRPDSPYHNRPFIKRAHGKVATKQHKTFTGKVVTKREAVNNGLTRSSVTKSKTVTDPDTEASKTKTTIKTTNGE